MKIPALTGTPSPCYDTHLTLIGEVGMLDLLKPWIGVRCRVWSKVRGEEMEWDYWTCLKSVEEDGEGQVWCSDGTVSWRVVEDGVEVEAETPYGTMDFEKYSEVLRLTRNWDRKEEKDVNEDNL